jgi:hypothetical protein
MLYIYIFQKPIIYIYLCMNTLKSFFFPKHLKNQFSENKFHSDFVWDPDVYIFRNSTAFKHYECKFYS